MDSIIVMDANLVLRSGVRQKVNLFTVQLESNTTPPCVIAYCSHSAQLNGMGNIKQGKISEGHSIQSVHHRGSRASPEQQWELIRRRRMGQIRWLTTAKVEHARARRDLVKGKPRGWVRKGVFRRGDS